MARPFTITLLLALMTPTANASILLIEDARSLKWDITVADVLGSHTYTGRMEQTGPAGAIWEARTEHEKWSRGGNSFADIDTYQTSWFHIADDGRSAELRADVDSWTGAFANYHMEIYGGPESAAISGAVASVLFRFQITAPTQATGGWTGYGDMFELAGPTGVLYDSYGEYIDIVLQPGEYTFTAVAASVTATNDSWGLNGQSLIQFTELPEPASLWLLSAAALPWIVHRRRA